MRNGEVRSTSKLVRQFRNHSLLCCSQNFTRQALFHFKFTRSTIKHSEEIMYILCVISFSSDICTFHYAKDDLNLWMGVYSLVIIFTNEFSIPIICKSFSNRHRMQIYRNNLNNFYKSTLFSNGRNYVNTEIEDQVIMIR